MIGDSEMQEEKFAVKDMQTGDQANYSRIELLALFSNQSTHYGRH
ncbi:MAG: hypothetical protein U5L96_04660 [Owenweeksia sp.]|nr:hypothetical protein [Owenweeksia sp.]